MGRGRKVTSLGVLFDFTGNDVNTTVQKVEDMVKEQWVRLQLADEELTLIIEHPSDSSLKPSRRSLTSSFLSGQYKHSHVRFSLILTCI